MQEESLHTSPQLEFVEQNGVAVALSHKQVFSLYKKSEQSGIPFATLEEVYRRGYREAIVLQELPEPYAFNRVNSFISGGAAINMDKDLSEKTGLWDNIHAKRERIKHGSGEHMRKPGSKGAPTAANFKTASESVEEANEPKLKPYNHPVHGKVLGRHTHMVDHDKDRGKLFDKETAVNHAKTHGGSIIKAVGNDKYFVKLHNEEYTGAEKVSSNPVDPSNRFDGTTSLVNNYKNATPGQSTKSRISVIKKIVKEQSVNEISVPAGTSGKRKEWHPPMVGIRMASGKIEKHPPGKSGSSGGGGK